ncbi:glycosyltransferase [Patescibacteria group bacterium]|nr:glycosyltransferase [Patescibacteria group bacterium]
MNSLVSIVILNYNGKKFNQACLSSVLQQSYTNFEIIFVDNASRDGSVEEVEKNFETEIISGKIKVIRNKINTGFSGGNNIGVAHADSQSFYICLLNNDTTVP